MRRSLGAWCVLVTMLLVILVGGMLVARAGPLSSEEIAARIRGIPTAMQTLACTTSSATASTALPTNSLVRIAIEGTGGIYYDFVGQGGSVTKEAGVYLANGLPPEYVQNGSAGYFACIVRSTSVTASLAIMR